MNGLIPPIVSLPGPAPLGSHLSAAALDPYCDAAAIVAAAQDKAHALGEQAQRELAAAREDAARVLDDAYRQGIASAQADLERRHSELIGDTVQWLTEAHEAEVHIADRLEARIRALIASVVEPYLRERDPVELLTRRVLARLQSELSTHAFHVYVAPASIARVRAGLQADRRVQVDPDPTLSDSQARLETPDAIVRFDVDRHLGLLLRRITAASEETCVDGQPN